MPRSRLLTPHRRTIAAVTAGALLLSGCAASGGEGGGTSTSGGSTALIAMSRCMRAHGISDFPDPANAPGGGVGLSVTMTPGSSAVTVAGIEFSGPAFTAAEKACRFGAYGTRPKLTAAQKRGMLKSAQCMRDHGVPNFPDPTFGAGGADAPKESNSQVNPDSPAFRAAARACRNVGMGLPGGG